MANLGVLRFYHSLKGPDAMGLLSKFFSRPLTPEKFARMMIKRLRTSGETATIEYDAEQFRIHNAAGSSFFLRNIYQQYLRSSKSDHEGLIRNFLSTWHTSGLKAPTDFEDAKADLMPAVRARAYLEINLHLLADGFRSKFDLPHQVIADHLVSTLVYDLPHSMMSVNDELLDKWGVTYYEAMEVAKQNLRAKTTRYAQLGSVYALAVGDAYDATRMLLTDLVRSLDVTGDPIAMVPNRERLYICGSDDSEGLETMLKFASEDLQHERSISGLAFRLADDDWETWMPNGDHSLYPEFQRLRIQSIGQTCAEQQDLLEKRRQLEGTGTFVATYSALENDKTGRMASFCTWTQGVDSLLPETDLIYLIRPESQQDIVIAAIGDWETVRKVVSDLMEPQGMYPERWRVREFPDAKMLARIGIQGA